jgi:hypothetical protein
VAAHYGADQGQDSSILNRQSAIDNHQGDLEMLKMKIEPAMCMKTKRARQNVMPKTRLFTRKCTNCARFDNDPSGFLAQNAQITRYMRTVDGRQETEHKRLLALRWSLKANPRVLM